MSEAIREVLDGLDDGPPLGVRRFDRGAALSARIVVLPSAFNPPTKAHLALLDLARQVTGAARTAALLTTRNVDKGLHGAPLEHRVGMLLAAGEWRGLAVLTTNAARFVDQGRALTAAFPGVEVDFVAGYDTLVRIFDTRYYTNMASELASFFAAHRLVATNRGADELAAARAVLDRLEARAFADRVLLAELDPDSAAMSSTDARSGRQDMLPAGVADYIAQHRLYT